MAASDPVRVRDVAQMWWPLALSWLLMAAEQPAIAGFVARLPNPELHLAAYGSVAFPIALVIEAPIISLLSASTELSRDQESLRSLQRLTHRMGAVLTALHLLVVATPLYDVIAGSVFGVSDVVADQARDSLWLMLPWTWAIAARRTGHGMLIRFGYGRWVTASTVVRLLTGLTTLAVCFELQTRGSVAAAATLSLGVLAEAAVVAVMVRWVAARHLPAIDRTRKPLSGRAFRKFYVPLAVMPLVTLVIQPIGTSAVSRMPAVDQSLALWPVLVGLVFVFQALAMSFNEVVVAMVARPGAPRSLTRFMAWLFALTLVVPLLLALTPLAEVWFGTVIGLDAELAAMAPVALLLAVPVAPSRVVQSWYQGLLVAARKTAAISEAIFVFAVACATVFGLGAWLDPAPGIYVGLVGFSVGRIAQTGWLAYRARGVSAATEASPVGG